MIVTLTDFGDNEYLGVMKGVIYSMYPDAKITDLFNHVRPQCVKEGAWVLYNNYKHFPKGSIFLCVVDPGVGSKRQSVVVRTKNYYFVGPDNGLMYPAANEDKIIEVLKLEDTNASKTFHGRDVFAKATASLEKGDSVGKKTELIEKLEFDSEVVRIDSFGNIITSIKSLGKKEYKININDKEYNVKFYSTYDKAHNDELFAIEGSCKTLELSVKNGNANKIIKSEVGDKIIIS